MANRLSCHMVSPNSTVWYYAKRQLTDRFRLIVWDLPGLGKSRKPKNNDYSLENMPETWKQLLLWRGNKPVILLGHSMAACSR